MIGMEWNDRRWVELKEIFRRKKANALDLIISLFVKKESDDKRQRQMMERNRTKSKEKRKTTANAKRTGRSQSSSVVGVK
jgi:hypothetical protein